MRKAFLGLMVVAALACLASAEDKVTLKGILMDKSCQKMKLDAKTHDDGCLKMADCVKSGYGVVTDDGKFVAFDAKGNKDVAAWLKTNKQKTNIQVTVTGTMDKDTLKVAEIK